jgi:hypothetical protein
MLEGGRPGCARHPRGQRQRQPQQQQRAIRGMAGWVRLQGTLQVRPCKLGRALLVCAVLRTRQDRGWASCPTRTRHASGPCRGHPRNRTHPAFDRFPVASRSTHAWMNLHRNRICRQLNEEHPRVAWIYVSTKVDTYQQQPNSSGKLSKAGRCRIAGCQPHGCGCQAPRDGFTASPQSDTAPPSHRMPAVADEVEVEVAGQRPALPPLRVQGAALPQNPTCADASGLRTAS